MTPSYPESTGAPTSLSEFIAASKAAAVNHLSGEGPKGQGLTIIMGNEAGDLDSAASAISLAYLLTHFPPQGLPRSIYVPLIQAAHADFHLRPENIVALQACGIDPQQLFCIDNLTRQLGLDLARSQALSPANGTILGLVDHCALGGAWGTGRQVSIVVDHHEDTGAHTDALLRVVRQPVKNPAGSCASVVADLFAPQFASAQVALLKEVADLLLSAILLDTDHLRAAPRGRAEQIDLSSASLLLPRSSFSEPVSSSNLMDTASSHAPAGVMLPESGARAITSPIGQPIDPETARGTTLAFSNLLSTCKAQVGNLSGRDLLRRDYKEVSVQDAAGAASVAGAEGAPFKLGVSSVPVGLASWLRKDQPISAEPEETWYHFWHTLDEWMAERGIQLAVVLNSFRGQKEGDEDNSKRRRELILAFSPPPFLSGSSASAIWQRLLHGLESDSGAPSIETRLMLEKPWKGARLASTGKKERVHGIDKDGVRVALSMPNAGGSGSTGGNGAARYAAVYKQANTKANRKVVLPALLRVLRTIPNGV